MNDYAYTGHMGTHLFGAFGGLFMGFLIIALVWSLIWKAFALWYSARNNQKAWFIVMIFLNSLGILEILYLLFFRKNKNNAVHTTTITHTVSTSTPAPDMALSEAPVPAATESVA